MIQILNLKITNYKAYKSENFDLTFNDYIFIGENDSGKSSILEAIDLLYNGEKVDKKYVRNLEENVVIEALILKDGIEEYYKKVFKKAAYKFEFSLSTPNINELPGTYIYISPEHYDISEIVKKLAVSKTINKLGETEIEKIKDALNEATNEVISSIDEKLIVVNSGITTNLTGSGSLKLEKSLDVAIESTGIDFEARGLGYRRNLICSLLAQSKYENVIIGIDEIENSLSLNNVKDLMNAISSNFDQSLLTTHSVHVLSVNKSFHVFPVYGLSGCETIADLYFELGKINENRELIIVEGMYDCFWISEALNLMGFFDEYLIVQANGCKNIKKFETYYSSKGLTCHPIYDGDTGEKDSLSKDCIEMYAPVDFLNKEYVKTLATLSNTKEDFFTKDLCGINREKIKANLAKKVSSFLTIDNPLILDLKKLLKI